MSEHFLVKVKYVEIKNQLVSKTKSCSKDFFNNTSYLKISLKSDPHLPKIFIIICFNDSPSKMMKNAFYFILKAVFVLKIFKLLSWFFGHVEWTPWLES